MDATVDIECSLCDPGPRAQYLYRDPHWSVSGSTLAYPGLLRLELRRHATSFADLTDAEAAAFGAVVQRTCRVLRDVARTPKIYLVHLGDLPPTGDANNGDRWVEHLHMALVPRLPQTPAGTTGLDVLADIATNPNSFLDPERAEDIAAALRARLAQPCQGDGDSALNVP